MIYLPAYLYVLLQRNG
ncbi:unnamed protein product [Clonostachys chloroleuca]|uniref:Uncharacterized protein n=1 Tax=Clonostachys chloroleuca TaxID=1926264 RepID=A0AA35LPM2_9HYPO|nr:unnamed protein product [Clonostachys chloroleuca]